MACRRFAGRLFGGLAVTRIKMIAIAAAVSAAAASVGGCATAPPPFSVEEQLWFDKATGSDLTGAPPGLRMHYEIGYPPPAGRVYRLRPPDEP
jgi:hypothetical protein